MLLYTVLCVDYSFTHLSPVSYTSFTFWYTRCVQKGIAIVGMGCRVDQDWLGGTSHIFGKCVDILCHCAKRTSTPCNIVYAYATGFVGMDMDSNVFYIMSASVHKSGG